jgi:uncharacterized membrane protein YeaQ/YmgE (transglycosylase-associated protein family)
MKYMKTMKKIPTVLIIIVIGLFIGTVAKAELPAGIEVTNVIVDPAIPAPLSTINFTVTISGENQIDAVNLFAKECNSTQGICFPNSEQNISMERIIGTDDYECQVTLIFATASYASYQFCIQSGDTWYSTAFTDVNLSIPHENNSNNNQSNNNGTKSPGFEIGLFIAVVGASIILLARKRFR